MNHVKLVEYLADGALVRILNEGSGKNPQNVWITPQTDGTFRYGPTQASNSVGGIPAPTGAVQRSRIFRPMEKEVIDFLCKFGLEKPAAESVIERIGLEPEDKFHQAAINP